MPFLTRDQLCNLSGFELNTFRSLRQRGQVPAVWDDINPEREAARGYSPLQVYLLMVADEIHQTFDVSRDSAAEIASKGFMAGGQWPAISRSSAAIKSGRRNIVEIVLAAVTRPDNQNTYFCGALSKLASEIPDATAVLAVSLSRVAAKLRQRAADHKIDLGDFWEPSRRAPKPIIGKE